MKPRHLILLSGVAAIGLAACGGDSEDSSATQASDSVASAESAASSSAATFNDADVEFAQGMIPHHEQAIEMAEIALDPTVGASEQVKALATQIQAAQDPEIQQMTAWLTEWGQPVQMDSSGGHDMSTMEGVMSAEEMDALAAARGADFDKMWMESMIRHHEGAISVAEAERANGANPDAVALAQTIQTAQQGEIDEMNALLAG